MERTLVILKPDAVKRKIIGDIISRFEKKNYSIERIQIVTLEKDKVEQHYAHVRQLPIYDSMIEYMTSGPSVIMVIEGEQVIQGVRAMVGRTSCFESLPGTIRGDYGSHRYKNLIHASDCTDSAELEIRRFFDYET